jgi:5-methylcytosine-specific restriction endonuclease McrA
VTKQDASECSVWRHQQPQLSSFSSLNLWDSFKQQQSQPVCRRCYKGLIDTDEASINHRLAEITMQAAEEVEKARERVQSLNEILANAQARQRRLIHRLLDRFRRTDPLPRLRRNISRAEQEINEAEHRLHLCERLPAHVKAARARHRSKRIAVEQRQQATTRVWLEKQGQRASQFQDVLDKVKLDRHLLFIRNKDYKRGNPLDNFIRSKWNQVIQAAFAGRCFICGVSSELTIDHLWLPKNEGGNFVMCVRESALLMSNLLLLCRSCNAAKGEAPVERFFSPDQMIELVDIQKLLSKQMMNDRELRRVAGRWYGRVIHPVGEPLA